MTDERETPSQDEPPSPGERRLARPPSDRYRAAEARAAAAAAAADDGESSASIARGVAVATVVAIVGTVAIVLLGGVLTITESLFIIAGFTGGGIGIALRWGAGGVLSRRQRVVLAVALAVAAVGLGQVGLWRYAQVEGGVLSFVDFLGQVYGPLAPLEVAAAAVLAWLAAR